MDAVKSELHGVAVKASSAIEVGDYFPLFRVKNSEAKLDLEVKATNYILLVFLPASLTQAQFEALVDKQTSYLTYFISPQATDFSHKRLFHEPNAHRICASASEGFTLCLLGRNLKVRNLISGDDYQSILEKLPKKNSLPDEDLPPPILVVPDVISEDLANRLVAYGTESEAKRYVADRDSKSRVHLYPSKELTLELDNKLSKSLLPEIQKVFYSDIAYRETYKICGYHGEDDGAFGKHRDTIDPYLHRRYAMSLVLNDEYEGGGILFPEYSQELRQVPKYSAVIFPGSLYHQVAKIETGTRWVLISFLFSKYEARPGKDERHAFQYKRDTEGMTLTSLMPVNGSNYSEPSQG